MNEVEFYQDATGDWRWRFTHWNRNILCDSGQGYTSLSDAKTGFATIRQALTTGAYLIAGTEPF